MGNVKRMALSHPFFFKSKKDSLSNKSVFLGEGIFTMGLVKTIYNVLGGFTFVILSRFLSEVLTNFTENWERFRIFLINDFLSISKSDSKTA